MLIPLLAKDSYPAISGFELSRYLGTWYEIARMDHSFERGLSNVTATYSMKDEGVVAVLNRGFDEAGHRWKEANGSAKFAGPNNVGRLKVTFFWPFYGGYNIMALDQEEYGYALIAGDSPKYLWVLCRQPSMPDSILQPLLEIAASEGFQTDDLIYVDQHQNLK